MESPRDCKVLHGYDIKKLYPMVFTSASPSPQHTPITEASQPSHQRIIPRAEDQAFPDNYTLILITKYYPPANPVQEIPHLPPEFASCGQIPRLQH